MWSGCCRLGIFLPCEACIWFCSHARRVPRQSFQVGHTNADEGNLRSEVRKGRVMEKSRDALRERLIARFLLGNYAHVDTVVEDGT